MIIDNKFLFINFNNKSHSYWFKFKLPLWTKKWGYSFELGIANFKVKRLLLKNFKTKSFGIVINNFSLWMNPYSKI